MPDDPRPAEETRRTIAAYDAHAEDYARRTAGLDPVADLLARFVAELPAGTGDSSAGARVLDAGCGAGRDTAYLSGQGYHVTGLDLSLGLLRCGVGQAPAGRFVQGDLTRLPYRAGTFAGVWACASLLHLPREHMPGALAALRRVMVPGGLLYLGMKRGEGAGWELAPTLAAAPRYFVYYQPEELAALVRAAGFRLAALEEGAAWLNVFARVS